MNFEKTDKKLIAVVISGFFLGIAANSASFIVDMPDVNLEDNIVYNIDSEKEFKENAIDSWGARKSTSLDEGIMKIGAYNVWDNRDFGSSTGYRTKLIKISNQSIRLDKFRLNGYIAENPESQIWIMLHDCTETLDKPDELVDVCYGDNIFYNKTIKNQSGPVKFEKDFSNVTVDGHISIWVGLLVDSDKSLPSKNQTYVDSIRLTKKCQSLECEFSSYISQLT